MKSDAILNSFQNSYGCQIKSKLQMEFAKPDLSSEKHREFVIMQ